MNLPKAPSFHICTFLKAMLVRLKLVLLFIILFLARTKLAFFFNFNQGFSRPKSASPLSCGPDPQLLMQMMQNHPGPQQRSPPTSQQQHHQQQQQRGVGGGSMSNTLAVSPLPIAPGRVPSPQDLVKHTQQIMQNALIKKKLKEQEESYR